MFFVLNRFFKILFIYSNYFIIDYNSTCIKNTFTPIQYKKTNKDKQLMFNINNQAKESNKKLKNRHLMILKIYLRLVIKRLFQVRQEVHKVLLLNKRK